MLHNNHSIAQLFIPNKTILKRNALIMVTFQALVTLYIWAFITGPLIPKPHDVINAFSSLVANDGLIYEIGTSAKLAITSLGLTILIALTLSYITVLPFFRPIAFIISKFRFLTLVGLSFVFTLYTRNGHDLKIALMVFGMTVFFVPGAVNIVHGVTRNAKNHARTLRMNEWEVVFRTQIRGTLNKMFELTRQNFAIAWMMLTMIEGLVRSEGGVGALLLNQNKHLHLDSVFAIQICILLVGISLDWAIGFLNNLFCPEAKMVLDHE